MQGLEVHNHQVMIQVASDGRLAFRLMPGGKLWENIHLREGSVIVPEIAPVTGLLYYATPSISESLTVRVEGIATPVLDRALGQWPATVDDDELETYPHLHFLEERKTGTPWRLERWYTLAAAYLIFDSQQYFERPRAAQHGKNWERLIVQLRQVVDLSVWEQGIAVDAVNLISGDQP
jgi:hypothetical protein